MHEDGLRFSITRKRFTPVDPGTCGKRFRERGFALVVTLSLMILLTIIAVGLLSLSAVSLRSSAQAGAQAEARANARLALMLAIGELQKHSGPDTRITAPSGIVDEDSPPLTGAWKSWEGSDHESTGRPVPPDYAAKTRPASDAGGRFLRWLVSGTDDGASATDPASLAHKSPTDASVPLVSTGTLAADDDRQVHLVPQSVGSTGTMAWWVGGENQKARLPRPYKPSNDSVAGWSDLAKSHAVPDPKPFELDTLLSNASMNAAVSPADKAISLATADLLAPDAVVKPREHFHDLSVNSVGLLTNAATGGWRKDMSLMTENWDSLPSSALPFFRLSPENGNGTSVTKPTTSDPTPAQSTLYPWGAYNIANTYQTFGPASSWASLREYAVRYKNIGDSSGGTYSVDFKGNDNIKNDSTSQYNKLHTPAYLPVIARMHWVFSHGTTVPNLKKPDEYKILLRATPVITLWNPYNVTLDKISPTGQKMYISTPSTPIMALAYYDKDGNAQGYRQIWRNANGAQNKYTALSSATGVSCFFPDEFNLAPGETKAFSPKDPNATALPGGGKMNYVDMSEGYRPDSGMLFTTPTILNADDTVKADLVFDAYGETVSSIGMYLDMRLKMGGSFNLGTDPRVMTYRFYPSKTIADQYWPPVPASSLTSPTYRAADLCQVEDPDNGPVKTIWKPFFASTFGSRVSSNTTVASRGVVQISPFVNDIDNRSNSYPGSRHPVNAPFDYSFHAVSANDTRMPNANNTNNRGYIISGFQSGDGLSRVILSDLPLRPVASLAELQNWDLHGQNEYPPHQINIIGNSDASPLIPANDVSITDMQHDDPYCANHLLFDDWFFSSIAPEPTSFGSSIGRNLETCYKDFLSGAGPLPNHSYEPILQDRALDSAGQTARYDEIMSQDGWERVASRLEVKGMFNVNSTSVKAWRALLGHCRNQKVPYFVESGMAMTPNPDTDHAFTRSIVAGDTKAGLQGISGEFSDSSQFTGYRVFTEDMLDVLAEKLVGQVRLRGPFLSLSEFVNRQLASGDLALAGAIQTALNEMEKGAAGNDPNAVLKNLSRPTVPDPPGDEQYKFREAAEGYSTYGLPGWIRQADVLRPLAPILSVRDDTFTIRAYGDARDANGKVIARAWCEATVQRGPDFVNPASTKADSIEPPDLNDSAQKVNAVFGRRFNLVSFRWLNRSEV